jgi:hypothetical protein
MAIIISKNGQKASKVDKSDLPAEDFLQSFIHKNPDCIPIYDIKENIKFFIAAREFYTDSGPIDALGFDSDGEIYIIETKLFRNTDKRYVVAQVMDYGASLYKHHGNFDSFINNLSNYSEKNFKEDFSNKAKEEFSIDDVGLESLYAKIEKNLNEGSFIFVILMDRLTEQLKDLVIFLNQNSNFTIIAVELDYYKFDDYEIITPRLFGIGTKPSSKITIPSDEDFINRYKGSENLEKIESLIKFFNDLKKKRISLDNVECYKTSKYLYFRVISNNFLNFSACLHINPEFEGGGIQFWTDKALEEKAKKLLRQNLEGVEIMDNLKRDYGKIAKWPLKYFKEDEFKNVLEKIQN